MNKKIIIGTRGSKLSLSYAEKVKHLLSFVTKKIEIKIQTIKTSGILIMIKKYQTLEEKIFSAKKSKMICLRKVDIAVHSLKDMDSFRRK